MPTINVPTRGSMEVELSDDEAAFIGRISFILTSAAEEVRTTEELKNITFKMFQLGACLALEHTEVTKRFIDMIDAALPDEVWRRRQLINGLFMTDDELTAEVDKMDEEDPDSSDYDRKMESIDRILGGMPEDYAPIANGEELDEDSDASTDWRRGDDQFARDEEALMDRSGSSLPEA